MFDKGIFWFLCIYTAVVVATDYNDPDPITEPDLEITVYGLKNDTTDLLLADASAEAAIPAAVPARPQRAAQWRAEPEPPECGWRGVAPLNVQTAAATAVIALNYSCRSLGEAAVAFLRGNLLPVMATRGWAVAVLHYPHFVVQLSRLLAELPAATRRLPEREKDRRLIQLAKKGAVQELVVLLEAGADVRAFDENRNTALHWAAASGSVEAVRRLLQARASVNARNNRRETPLYYAVWNGSAAVVRLLAGSSADPNARADDASTPLHWAAYWGHTEAAAALLEAGADRGARDANGDTPLDKARQSKKQKLVDMLT
ncbi:putative ankyrin repeat protein RF_0381 isoform X4 [Schistocerca gregaria]|uniref:putative ankyrin repeat protein RF_0381 isoform X4 n=1 Tax=Schistocerca gregaria TaxID=7010 RepID=UPI00211EEA40|nr:putative ankyrin repeat protein RF_0381 isoform X4 [Schistocerca gregaria]